MNNGIFIIAHAPLASALRQCVAHVFPDRVQGVLAQDVLADASPQESLAAARQALAQFNGVPVLVLTDMLGATPCNVARALVDGMQARLVAGVNVPMLLRAVTYQQEPLEELVARALGGGTQGVVQVV
jgi:PTS system ascorbate-specific IIA component